MERPGDRAYQRVAEQHGAVCPAQATHHTIQLTSTGSARANARLPLPADGKQLKEYLQKAELSKYLMPLNAMAHNDGGVSRVGEHAPQNVQRKPRGPHKQQAYGVGSLACLSGHRPRPPQGPRPHAAFRLLQWPLRTRLVSRRGRNKQNAKPGSITKRQTFHEHRPGVRLMQFSKWGPQEHQTVRIQVLRPRGRLPAVRHSGGGAQRGFRWEIKCRVLCRVQSEWGK